MLSHPELILRRDQLIVRSAKGEAERYQRLNDAPLGKVRIEDSRRINNDWGGIPGQLFMIDTLKRLVADPHTTNIVSDDVLDGRPVKLLDHRQEGAKPGQYSQRLWIDMARGGHVVMREFYTLGNVLTSKYTIHLSPFQIDDQEIWMPTRGRADGYAAWLAPDQPAYAKEPTNVCEYYIIDGTLEFNQKPGNKVFSREYKGPGRSSLDRPVIGYFHDGRTGHFAVLNPLGQRGTLIQRIDPPHAPRVMDAAQLFSSRSWTGKMLRPSDPRWTYFLGSTALLSLTVAALIARKIARRRIARKRAAS